MSTRQLKKLQKQQELARLQSLAQEDEDGSSEEGIAPPKPRASAFAGFAALQDDDDADDANEQESENDQELEEPEAPPKPVPAKKNKKPKKKKKAKQAAAAPPTEDEAGKPKPGGLDEIDLALKELNIQTASSRTAAAGTAGQAEDTSYDTELARLLSIRFHHLKRMHELRAMFGQDIIESQRRQEEAQARDDRRRNRGRRQQNEGVDLETFLKGRPDQKISAVVLRNNPFIQGVPDWPKATAGGLKMEIITDARVDPTEYTFTHDRGYQALEAEFFALVDMMDPMQIVHFVSANPYHVNALVQTSRFAHHQDHNAPLARDLCERALFNFGRVTVSSFRKKLERGVARLDFRRPENRQFWLAGYHYIQALERQGTYVTALEWSKMYLSLSPGDEYAMMNFVHYLAIMAHEARWFLDLCQSTYFTWDEYNLPMKEYYKQTCVLAKLQLGDKEGALEDLVKGMETLPWLYSAICSALNIDVPRSIWGVQPRDERDTLYTELYIHMVKDLWKQEATGLLKEAGEKAQKVNIKSLPRAREIPLSIGRFIYLDGNPELMRLVPSSMLHATPNFDYDPLPPPLEENIFSSEMQSLPWRRNERSNTAQILALRRRMVAEPQGGQRRGVATDDVGGSEDDDDDDDDENLNPDEWNRDAQDDLMQVVEQRINEAEDGESRALLYTLARRFLPVRWLWGGNPPPDEETEVAGNEAEDGAGIESDHNDGDEPSHQGAGSAS